MPCRRSRARYIFCRTGKANKRYCTILLRRFCADRQLIEPVALLVHVLVLVFRMPLIGLALFSSTARVPLYVGAHALAFVFSKKLELRRPYMRKYCNHYFKIKSRLDSFDWTSTTGSNATFEYKFLKLTFRTGTRSYVYEYGTSTCTGTFGYGFASSPQPKQLSGHHPNDER